MPGVFNSLVSRLGHVFKSADALSAIPAATLEEEGIENYHIGGLLPVSLGEVYGSKYKVLRKLGYGQYSTVWLVRDEQ